MKQVFQDIKGGTTQVHEIPAPICAPGQVKIRTSRTLISAGTERMLVEFGRSSLLGKARSQPDKVKQVLTKMKTDGIMPTLEAVFSVLGEPMPVGYCNVGTVLEVGEGVTGFRVGQRVVSNGPHAEIVCIPPNLCAAVPDSVSDDDAVFTVLASIALQGVRLAAPTLGETVFVSGLGLIGLMTVQILRANGCQVIGADFNPERLALAAEMGCHTVDLSAGMDPVKEAMALTDGRGVDAVLITAATKSNEPVTQAAAMSRQRGRIILVGVAGLELDRRLFYAKELSFQVSCSYGPGRYDSSYEDQGHDYPLGFVRWTEQRNFQAVLGLLADGNLKVAPLVSDILDLADAPQAYDKLMQDSSALGVVLRYSTDDEARLFSQTVEHGDLPAGDNRFGILGAGNFTRRTMLPAMKKSGWLPSVIASAGGRTAAAAARSFGIPRSTTDGAALLADPDIQTVMITTRHDAHPAQVEAALAAGKHVFVEKPLAIDMAGLAQVVKAYEPVADRQHLMVGFNRRFSPHLAGIAPRVHARSGPLCLSFTVNAGAIPADHWVQDPAVGGGRIIGEGCHFIDVFRFLANSPITTVSAQQVAGSSDGLNQDKMTIMMQTEDGSIGTIHYWANGHASFPKETCELFFDGGIVRMENFKKTESWGVSGLGKISTKAIAKGHREQFDLFGKRLQEGGEPLIPFAQLVEVTLASMAAVTSAESGTTQALAEWHQRLRD